MTAAVLAPNIQKNPTPFCDTSYKGIRVLSQFVGRALYALALQIASLVCQIFNKPLAQTYLSMASAQFRRGCMNFLNYSRFGKHLIDFSYNGYVLSPSSDTEQNALRAEHGDHAFDQWLQIGTDKIPLRVEHLNRQQSGFCFGMSLDFIKQYLQETQRGISPSDAIRAISSRYVTGAPKEAQLAQIFYAALDINTLNETEVAAYQQTLERQAEDNLTWVHSAQEKIQAISEEDQGQILAEANRRAKKLKRDRLRQTVQTIARAAVEPASIISQQLGLQISPYMAFGDQQIPTKCPTKYQKFFDNLPQGCYQVIWTGENIKHAISLIKSSDDSYFLFDPDYGTLMFHQKEMGENLWKMISANLPNTFFSLSFFRCELK